MHVKCDLLQNDFHSGLTVVCWMVADLFTFVLDYIDITSLSVPLFILFQCDCLCLMADLIQGDYGMMFVSNNKPNNERLSF